MKVLLLKILLNEDGPVVIENKYKTLTDFYIVSCKSSKLDIYLVSDVRNLESWDLNCE